MRLTVDTFSVKPTGTLASWRYARVYIDSLSYVVTTGDVPGKESINLPCISDYNKKSRRYNNGDLILDFFNPLASERVFVYAQDCTPFANAVAISEAPPTPPTPPPNPYGTAAYGLFKYHRYCDIDGRVIRIEIDKRDYVGADTEIVTGGETSVTISRKPLSELTDPIHPVEYNFQFVSDQSFDLLDIYTDDGRMFRTTIRYEDTGEILGRGFVEPSSASEPFIEAPYVVSFRATDGIGALKGMDYPMPYGGRTNLRQTWLSILQYCFSKTAIELPLYTMVNLYERKMPNGLSDDPLNLSSVNPLRFSDDKGNIMNCYDVLVNVCNEFNSYITQADGNWNFIRLPELSNPVVRRRLYSSDGIFLNAEQIDNTKLLGYRAEVELLASANIEYHDAYKRVSVLHKFGFVPSVIFNGDFEEWDGTNFGYWTNINGVDISQSQNSIPGIGGAPLLVNDYSMQFNQQFDLSKYMMPNNVRVTIGDKLSMSINVGSNSPAKVYDRLRMRVKIDDGTQSRYLRNGSTVFPEGDARRSPQWVESVTDCIFGLGYGAKSINSFIFTLDLPVAPFSGDIQLQFYGFEKIDRLVVIGGVVTPILYPYAPMQIDNVSLSITNTNNNALPDGILYISEQQKFFVNSPDTLTLLFGDNVPSRQVTNMTTDASEVLANNISSIFTSDGSLSTLWYEYELSTNQLPIANWAAKGMLKLYQRPFRVFSAGAKGDFSALTIFQICQLDNQSYAIKSGDYDLKRKQFNRMVLVETFYRNIATNDVGIPHNPGQGLPPIFNNPNIPPTTPGDRIFTEQFTEQFM